MSDKQPKRKPINPDTYDYTKRWINPQEYEFEFGPSEATQAKWRQERSIPYSKRGNFIYYAREKINKQLEESSFDVA